MTLSLSLPESKRIRKPSKRLIEWTEEYDHIFASKKKAKKQPDSLQKVILGFFFFFKHCFFNFEFLSYTEYQLFSPGY